MYCQSKIGKKLLFYEKNSHFPLYFVPDFRYYYSIRVFAARNSGNDKIRCKNDEKEMFVCFVRIVVKKMTIP